jgi:hypothetical protein
MDYQDYHQEQKRRLEEIRSLIEKSTELSFYECKVGEHHKSNFTIASVTDLAARLFLELPEQRQKLWLTYFNKDKS